jgi:hypothetical protein
MLYGSSDGDQLESTDLPYSLAKRRGGQSSSGLPLLQVADAIFLASSYMAV